MLLVIIWLFIFVVLDSCWLTADRGVIWAFVGPVVVILAVSQLKVWWLLIYRIFLMFSDWRNNLHNNLTPSHLKTVQRGTVMPCLYTTRAVLDCVLYSNMKLSTDCICKYSRWIWWCWALLSSQCVDMPRRRPTGKWNRRLSYRISGIYYFFELVLRYLHVNSRLDYMHGHSIWWHLYMLRSNALTDNWSKQASINQSINQSIEQNCLTWPE